MSDGYNFRQLKAAILAMSKATDWETARKEWALVDIIEADEPETCLCGHFPIVEICAIHNRVTGHSTEVGNVCVKRFLGVRSDLIFTGIKRIRKDPTKSLNADSIAFFRQRGLINDWEYGFLQDTMKKRNLSLKQMGTRKRINLKVLGAVSRRGLQAN
ncbi:hypothetical protein [Boseongicola sp. H5]|uniref:hypothetical protein n=1 Tax=Boseongicola sp. H5 TaxID=2763261 RepID=UPI001D09D75F|nr:hypothetical protein [Boseongicola sp. H5]